MSKMVKMTGRLLLFDKIDKLGLIFPKDCELTYPEKCPVAWQFKFNEPTLVMGTASVTKDEKGLICDVELTNFDRDILHNVFHDESYIGGYYNKIKRHKENGATIIDKCNLVGIGITLGPADEEMKMVVKEEMKDDKYNNWRKMQRKDNKID